MDGIEELRQRVQDAEQHFGLAREEQVKYSERLVGLLDAVETRLRDQQAEIDAQQAIVTGHTEALATEQSQIKHLESDNEHLREMLHSLLQAIEIGGRGGVVEIMQTLDRKVSALIADGAAPAEAASEPEPVAEPVAEPAAEPEPEPEMAAASEPEAESAPEPAMEADPEPEPEVESVPNPEMEATPEPESELAPPTELEAMPEPVAEPEAELEPEPEPEMPADPEMEAAPVPAEPIEEPASEPLAESADATSGSITAALAEITSQLAAKSTVESGSDDMGAESDSLHEIMDRVSKLVRDTESNEATAPAEDSAPAGPDASSQQKSVAG